MTFAGRPLDRRAARSRIDRRPRRAAKLYERLVALEPAEPSHRYGLAGSWAEAGEEARASAIYAKLAAADSRADFARGEQTRIADASRDRGTVRYFFASEDSPDRLADVERQTITVEYGLQLGRSWRLELGPKTWVEMPGGVARPYVSTGGTLSLVGSVSPDWKSAGSSPSRLT